MSNKSGKIKSLLLSVAVLLNAFSLSLWPAYEGRAAETATFELYSKVVGTKCTDSNDASFTRAVDPQDAGAVVVYTIRIANSGGEEYTGDITTKNLSSGMTDINGGTVKNNPDDGSTYQIRTYINQRLSVGNVPESARISISKVAMANDAVHTYSEVSKYFVYKNPTTVQAAGTVIQANINYLCGSLTLKKEQDGSGNKFPDNATFTYKVSLEGDETLNGRKVHVDGTSTEATFVLDESANPAKCSLSMNVTVKAGKPAVICGLPIGVKYSVSETAVANYTQTSASGLNGTIEKIVDGNILKKHIVTGSSAEASITSKYTGNVSPTASPTPKVDPTASPTPKVTPEIDPTANPTPEVTPEITPEVEPTSSPTLTPEVEPTTSPEVEPTEIPTPEATPEVETITSPAPEVTPEVNPGEESVINPTTTDTPSGEPVPSSGNNETAQPSVQPAEQTPAETVVQPTSAPAPVVTVVQPTPAPAPVVTDGDYEDDVATAEEGSVYSSATARYIITGDNTASFKAPVDKNITEFSISRTVTIDGKTYKVTSIESKAFKNCKKLKKVIISSNIKKIKKKAFYGCKSLKNVIIKTKLLGKKSIGAKAFGKINSKAVFKVPGKQIKNYKKYLKESGIPVKSKIKKDK